jgi:hypothetical protein
MNKVNGKNKGNTFERKIANLLSDRFAIHLGIEKGFRRNPDSGSFFGGQNESRTETYGTEFAIFGDLICPKSFQFSIECKHYKSSPTFQSFLNSEIKEWDLWISQAEQDSKKSSKKMCLIIKYNNVDEFVVTNNEIIDCKLRFLYKEKFAYKLSDILLLPDAFFFN